MLPTPCARALCLLVLLLLCAWLTPCSAYSQTTKPATVDTEQRCLSVRQLAKINDSLNVLPKVRAESSYWYDASLHSEVEKRELRRSLEEHVASLDTRTRQLNNERQKAKVYKNKLGRSRVLNWLLVSAAAVFTGYKLTR